MVKNPYASVVKYDLPAFLIGVMPRANYVRWLARKATAHSRRDRKRLPHTISIEEHKQAIHQSVEVSKGLDWYTGEELDWHKISTYNNDESKAGRSVYKGQFALLPTVDHVLTESGRYEFVICSWRTNDSKNDLTLKEFTELCRRVLTLHGTNTALLDQ